MKIRKVDDKPMVIHTKEKAKIHAHEPKGAKIKGSNIYTVERGPKVHDAKANEMDKKASAKLMLQKSAGGKRTYRKSTIHQSEAIIQKYNDTQCDIEETTIQREFKKVASKYPEHVIVSDIEGEMTCVELDKKSNQIAHYLISNGVKSGDIIGVLGKRKKETIMNIVGILKAGAAYVAIDPTYPKERQEYILSNSGSTYLLEPEFYETYNINQYSDTALDITYHPEDIA